MEAGDTPSPLLYQPRTFNNHLKIKTRLLTTTKATKLQKADDMVNGLRWSKLELGHDSDDDDDNNHMIMILFSIILCNYTVSVAFKIIPFISSLYTNLFKVEINHSKIIFILGLHVSVMLRTLRNVLDSWECCSFLHR